jgi:hypothetical protein
MLLPFPADAQDEVLLLIERLKKVDREPEIFCLYTGHQALL